MTDEKKVLWLACEYTLSDEESQQLVEAIDDTIGDEYQVILTRDIELLDVQSVRELIEDLEASLVDVEEGQPA